MRQALRVFNAILVTAILVAATTIGVLYLDRLIRARMTDLRDRTLAAIEQVVGRRITYASLSPSILQRIDIRDLAIHARDDPERVALSVRNLQVRFSLLRLLRADPLQAITEVSIVNSRLRFNLAADRDLADLLQGMLKADGSGSGLSARLSGSGVDVELVLPGTTLQARGLAFTIAGEAQQLVVNLRGSLGAQLRTGATVSTLLAAQGRVGRDLSWSDMMLQVSAVSSSWLSAGRQTLELAWKSPRLEIRKIQDRQPVDLLVVADVEQGTLEASLSAEGLRLDQLFTLESALLPDNRLMAVPFTGRAHASWQAREGRLQYEAELSADLADLLPVRDVHFTGKVHGDQQRAVFDSLVLTSPHGNADFAGDILVPSMLPEGRLTVSNFPLPNDGLMNATVTLQRREGGLVVAGQRISLGKIGLDFIDASVVPHQGSLGFQLRTSLGRQDSIFLAGDLRLSGHPELTLRGDLANVPPELVYELSSGTGVTSLGMPGLPRLLEPLTITTSFSLSTDFSLVVLSSPRVTIASKDSGGLALSSGVSLSRGSLALSGLEGSWKGVSFGGDFSLRSEDSIIHFTADTRIQGQGYQLAGTWSARNGFSARGSSGLEVAAVPAGTGWRLAVKGEGLPIPLDGRTWRPTFNLYGMASSLDSWEMAGSIAVSDLPLGRSAPATIQCDLTAGPRRVDFARLVFTDPFSTLEGRGSIELDASGGTFPSAVLSGLAATFSFSAQGRGTSEAYTVNGTWRGGAIAAEGKLTSSPLVRLGSFLLKGELSGSARASGTLGSVAADLELALVNGRLGSDPIAAQARCTVSGGRVDVADLSVRYLDHQLSGFAGYADLAKGEFRLRGGYQGLLFSDKIQLQAELSGSSAMRDARQLAAQFFQVPFTGAVSLDSIKVAGMAYPGFKVSLRTGDGLLHFDGGPQNGLHGTLDRSMGFTVTAAQPLPMRGTATGRLVGDRIEASVNLADFDLRVVNDLMKTDVYTVESGMAWGQFSILGPLNDPDFQGTLRVRDGAVSLRYTPDRIGPISGVLDFNQRVLTSQPFATAVGAARMGGTASFTFDHWVPVAFQLDAATLGGTTPHIVNKFGRAVVDGYATGSIRLTGDDRRVDLTGSVAVPTAHVTLGAEEPGVGQPEAMPTFVNLTVETGKRVEFTWPSDALPVVRTTAASGGKLVVTYRGDTGGYSVTGTVTVHGGDVFYFDRSFVLKSGTITFNENEQSFDPRVVAHGEGREYDPRDGKLVRIYLDADGALSKFSPRLSSDPTLPESEILALLGAPIMERVGGQGVFSSAVMLSSDLLSTFGLLRPFEARVRDALGLDVFSIRTQILQNLIAQKVFNTPGLSPLDNTSLSLGKYLGDDLFLELLVGLQAPRGPTGLVVPGAGLQSDLEVNLEWDTPFFLLEWSFQPRHPDALFLTDNSLALSWRYAW